MIKRTIVSIAMSIFFFGSVNAAEIDCMQCHSDIAQGKTVHAAVATGCTSCHTAIDARDIPHRVKNQVPKGLSSAPPGLCYGCHDKALFEKKNIHGALGIGCSACHNPHSSGNARLVRAEMPDLCYACHDNRPFAKRNTHSPVAAGQCTACHLPHSSENATLLDKPVKDLCDACHGDKSGKHILAGFGLGDTHPAKGKPDPAHPGKEMICASCHIPHSSSGKFLLTDAGPSGNLCLMCHDKIIVRP